MTERYLDIDKMPEEAKDKLPTILDVIDLLSQGEVDNMVSKIGIIYDFLRFDNGKYIEMSNYHNSLIKCLMPGSQSPFTLLRGQNQYYSNCVPSLYRTPKGYSAKEFELICRIQMQEFLNVLAAHPVVREFQYSYEMDGIALAQHYGFPTEYLDITNSKWVAAFFAVTEFQSNNKYVPVGRDYGNGVGVMYVAIPKQNDISYPLMDRIRMVGFHYFNRPTSQNAIVLPMKEGENFNDNIAFKPILFRHDLDDSKLVFEMAYKQVRFFSEDFASKVAEQINCHSYVYAWSSVEQCREQFSLPYSDDEIKNILTKYGYKWHFDEIPRAGFNIEKMKTDMDDWNRYGRTNFYRRIVQTPLCYSL